ncbi:MAG: hypothetical protein ACRD40_03080, partial [Candidatus Acidiferrales bacterium]
WYPSEIFFLCAIPFAYLAVAYVAADPPFRSGAPVFDFGFGSASVATGFVFSRSARKRLS